MAIPNLQYLVAGTVAGRRLFDVTDRTPAIKFQNPHLTQIFHQEGCATSSEERSILVPGRDNGRWRFLEKTVAKCSLAPQTQMLVAPACQMERLCSQNKRPPVRQLYFSTIGSVLFAFHDGL
jgi:hypothetical protein